MQRKKPVMKDIINNIKTIKIIRDINLIKNESIFYNTNMLRKNKIYKNKKYYNLLNLINNKIIFNSFQNKSIKKLTSNALKNINLILYENICEYDNIIVIDIPVFQTSEIIDGLININSYTVCDYDMNTKLDVITFIKSNQNKLIYLYLITDNKLRCKCIRSKNYLSQNRKEKLKKLKEKEDI